MYIGIARDFESLEMNPVVSIVPPGRADERFARPTGRRRIDGQAMPQGLKSLATIMRPTGEKLSHVALAVGCVLLLLAASPAGASEPLSAQSASFSGDPRSFLERALSDFDEGVALSDSAPDKAADRLRAAAEGFESVARSGGAGGALYYNLGNAYLRLGRLGMAIANYRRAERLIPGDGNLESNLAYARGHRRNQIEAAGSKTVLRTLFFWHYRLPLRTRFLIAATLYVAFWLVLIVRPYLRQVGLGLAAAVLAVGWITFGASAGVSWGLESRERQGVITADEVVVRKGNGENYDPEFKQLFYDGVEFTVRERRGDWLKIELPDGGKGWIRAEQAELL